MVPIRILHVITTLSAGGAEMMLCKLLSALHGDEFTNSVVSLKVGGELEARARSVAHRVETLDMRRPIPDPRAFFKLYRIIREVKPHIVQTWLYHADFLGYLAARAARVPAIAWNVRCSDMGDAYYRGISGLVVRGLAVLSSRPEAIVVNSLAGRDSHKARGYQSRHWRVIPNGFDLDQFQPDADGRARVRKEIGVAEDVPLIGLVARFDTVKGHRTFLSAAQFLAKEYPQSRFVLVGRGCVPGNLELRSLFPPSLIDRVLLLGHREDVAQITAAFDIATCASSVEGFPNVVGEAMSCGVPCVVTDVGDTAEVVGETGITVPSDSPRDMAEAWRKLLLEGPDYRQKLGGAARERIRTRYSINEVSKIYASLYRELAFGNSSRTLR